MTSVDEEGVATDGTSSAATGASIFGNRWMETICILDLPDESSDEGLRLRLTITFRRTTGEAEADGVAMGSLVFLERSRTESVSEVLFRILG